MLVSIFKFSNIPLKIWCKYNIIISSDRKEEKQNNIAFLLWKYLMQKCTKFALNKTFLCKNWFERMPGEKYISFNTFAKNHDSCAFVSNFVPIIYLTCGYYMLWLGKINCFIFCIACSNESHFYQNCNIFCWCNTVQSGYGGMQNIGLPAQKRNIKCAYSSDKLAMFLWFIV